MLPEDIENFKSWGVPLPSRDPHGTDSPQNPGGSQLQKVAFSNWRLRGNMLTADTQFGEYAHVIPPDYIMVGIDAENLPILKKIVV